MGEDHMSVPDFAHTKSANRNRTNKAWRIVGAARACGIPAHDLRADGSPECRTRVLGAASVARASEETWGMVSDLLRSQAAQRADGQCPACGEPTRSVVTEVGQKMVRIDPEPVVDGVVTPVETAAGMRARVVAGDAPRPEDVEFYRFHSSTCAARKPLRQVEDAPLCRVCGLPMDAQVYLCDPSYRSHPACGPEPEGR